jgi:hypothetical protein
VEYRLDLRPCSPKSILHSTIDISSDWSTWAATDGIVVLEPEHPWEGSTAPVVSSERSTAHGTVNQLRDPAIFTEEHEGSERSLLLYAVPGECGIALAEIDWTV